MTKHRQRKHTLVICGNFNEYLAYLQEHNIPRHMATYVHNEDRLRGYRGDEVRIVWTGKYWLNPVINSPVLAILIERIRSIEEQGE